MTKWLSPSDFLEKYLKRDDGTYLISRGTLMAMCRTGQIPCTRLGTQRRYFIPLDVCEQFGSDLLKHNCDVKSK